jgi:hypothetical protein
VIASGLKPDGLWHIGRTSQKADLVWSAQVLSVTKALVFGLAPEIPTTIAGRSFDRVFARRFAVKISSPFASQTVQVVKEAKARAIMTALTILSAFMNIDNGERSCGKEAIAGDVAMAGSSAAAALPSEMKEAATVVNDAERDEKSARMFAASLLLSAADHSSRCLSSILVSFGIMDALFSRRCSKRAS